MQAAVSGVLSKAITGGAVTLTAAEASNAVIAFSGTLTSNATITFPTTVQRVWVVSNVTSGAFTLTVKSGTGNTVVVTQGRRGIVFSDGVDMNQADTDIVPAANGGTGVTSDIRMKDLYGGVTDALDKLAKISKVFFNYKGKTDKQFGYTAQSVEAVLPEAVSERDARDHEKQFVGDKVKVVDYNAVATLQAQAIDELHALVKKQQLQIDALIAALAAK